DKLATMVLASFYLKKPLVTIANVLFIVLMMALNLDAWYKMILPWLFVSFMYMHAQASNAPLVSLMNQKYGFPFGVLRWLLLLPSRLFPFFTSLIPIYDDALTDKGLRGIPEFPPTLRTDFEAHRPWRLLYEIDKSAIRTFMILAPIIGLFAHYHPMIF